MRSDQWWQWCSTHYMASSPVGSNRVTLPTKCTTNRVKSYKNTLLWPPLFLASQLASARHNAVFQVPWPWLSNGVPMVVSMPCKFRQATVRHSPSYSLINLHCQKHKYLPSLPDPFPLQFQKAHLPLFTG